jgi:putative inorganic carbon (HCO3(-)) transporter
MNYLVYFCALFFSFFLPISITNLLRVYIISILFDEFRILDISLTNIILTILVLKFLFNYQKYFKINNVSVFFILFGIVVLMTFLFNFNSVSTKNFISLVLMLLSSVCISQVVRNQKDRDAVLKSILYMSIITSYSVIFETFLYYVFNIQLHDSLFSLMNLSTDFYFSSGFFSSNGIASFHIIPGLVILLFGDKRVDKYNKLLYLILALGLILTMTRGGILIGIIIAIIFFFKYLQNVGRLYKYFGYTLISISIILAANFVVFISYFNISSIVARLYIINGALSSIKQKPILGSGLASQVTSSETNFDLVDMNQVQESVLNDNTLRETHNTFLQIGVETGLLGLFLIILLIISLIINQKKSLKNDKLDIKSKQYHYISFMMLSLFLISINMNSYLYLKLFWLILAAFSSIKSIGNSKITSGVYEKK